MTEQKALAHSGPAGETHPLDVVEQLATDQEWDFKREDTEITFLVAGKWADYQVAFTWIDEIETIHLSCGFELKTSEARRAEIEKLIAKINQNLWVGHLDLCGDDGLVMYRHGHVCTGGVLTPEQCRMLVGWGTETCERYFPAFQYVHWAGKLAQEALEAVEFKTVGEA